MTIRANHNTKGLWNLTCGKEYVVIGLDEEYYRIVDDYGEPVLFEKFMFNVVDDAIPDDWIWQRNSDDDYCADPPGLNVRGFYEDFFDRKEYAIKRLNDYLRTIGIAIEARPLDALPAALAGKADSGILTTKKLLVALDTSKKERLLNDFLFPVNVGVGPVLCGMTSGATADYGVVVDTGAEVTEVEILDKQIKSVHRALNNSLMPAMLGKYMEQLQAFQIGNVVMLKGTSAEDIALEQLSDTQSSFVKRYNICNCCPK